MGIFKYLIFLESEVERESGDYEATVVLIILSSDQVMANLFYACMGFIVCSFENLGKTGIILISGDSLGQQCYPILAAYVGNYPKQILVALVKCGLCSVCPAWHKEIGGKDSAECPHDIGPI